MKPIETEFKAASGIVYSIRETNGDDDAILSNIEAGQKGTNVNNWLSAVIMGRNGDKKKPTPEECGKIVSKDRAGIMFHSRIFSIGPILKFIHTCRKKDCGFKPADDLPYEEDLTLYHHDFKNPLPEFGEPGYSPLRITPYTEIPKEWVNLTLSSNKKIRYAYLDGEGENVNLEVPLEDLNINMQLLAHKIEMEIDGKWVRLQNFKPFNSRDMMEMRSDINKRDKPWDPISEITCPKCKTKDRLNLLSVPDFFYPTGI